MSLNGERKDMSRSLQRATLLEIRHAAARLCRDFLTGRWKEMTPEKLIVKRISGGLSNFLYFVSLPEEEEDDKNTCVKSNDEKDVISPNTVTRKSECSCHDDDSNNELALPMCALPKVSSKQAHKRHRCDSDGGESSMSKRMHAFEQEPQAVLVRIYGQAHGDHAMESMITETVVFALLSERNLGPKLYGIFPGGRIEQYLSARPLTTLELSEQRILIKVAEKMGDIHSMNIPMSKEPDWIWTCMQRWVSSLLSIIKKRASSVDSNKRVEVVRAFDYDAEIAWLKGQINAGDYPVVFCHNDLQEGNILMRQTPSGEVTPISIRSTYDDSLGDSLDGNSNLSESDLDSRKIRHVSPGQELDTTNDSALDASFNIENEPDLIIIDFEYCAYNYRGYDLANHFIEWTFDYTNPQFPFYHHRTNNTATFQQRRDFIVNYLKKFHDNENYSPTVQELDKLEQEVQLFTMLSHMFWSLWSVINVESEIQFGYWEYGVTRINEYQKHKAAYIKKSVGESGAKKI